MRSFLGFCTYYRRFISKFAYIAKPLTKLTREMDIRVFHGSRDHIPGNEKGIV